MILLRSARWPRVFRDERHLGLRPPAAVWLLGLSLLIPPGCASHKQVQYFAATDPETGLTNYYKMTVSGGGMGVKYNMQAGYFSAAAVDILRGSMPEVPTLDMTLDHEEHFRRITDHFYDSLLKQAKAIAPLDDPETCYLAAVRLRDKAINDLDAVKREKAAIDQERLDNETAIDATMAAVADAAEALTLANQLPETTDAERAAKEQAVSAAQQALDSANRLRAEANLKAEALTTRTADADAAVLRLQAEVERTTTLAEGLSAQAAEGFCGSDSNAAEAVDALEIEDRILRLARLSWYASLSDSDVISVGMTESNDPYQFRKLVFWTTATNLDLNRYASEIDTVLDNVTQIASSYRTMAEQRKAQKKSQHAAITGVIDKLPIPAAQKESLKGLMNMFSPAAPEPAGALTGDTTP